MTAAELASTLAVSAGGISGAVAYLERFGMLRRERERGSRRDVYVVDDDAWHDTMMRHDQIYGPIRASFDHAVTVLGTQAQAHRRIAMTRDLPCHAVLCRPGLYNHTAPLRSISASRTRSASPGLAPVNNWKRIAARRCGVNWGRTASTCSTGTGLTGSDSRASLRPFCSPRTAVSARQTDSSISSSPTGHLYTRTMRPIPSGCGARRPPKPAARTSC